MAEGLLLILIGDENKQKEKYLKLKKEYICDILFDIETDTHDILGMVHKNPQQPAHIPISTLKKKIQP